MSIRSRAAVLAIALVALAEPAARAEEASLPGGATSLRESHGDWQVSCAIQAQADGSKRKLCALSQEQFARDTRRRVLAVELHPDGGKAAGSLVLPFGLALDQGAAYQIDDGQTSATHRFRTCLPVGCLIDLAFDARTIAALRSGKALKVRAIADGGQEMTFSISLAGYASAYDRVSALMK